MIRKQENFFQKNKKKLTLIAAIAIFSIGLFLRTYHFHDWLNFESDQARDASIVENVVDKGGHWPLLGPDMSHSQDSGVRFHVGPMYYYFQIISGRIFGALPETAAYPDLLFAILSIPLFYLFLKRCFSDNLSLTLTGLYAVSFYIIQYSRFAYNTNPIPFFVILFLLALLEFLDKREKVSWTWVVLAGIALGVGVQLHVTLLVVFPVIAFFVFFHLAKNNRQILEKLGVVVLVALILNLGQLIYEAKNNFENSKVFFHSIARPDLKSTNSLPLKLAMDADCQLQANFHILSSMGDKVSCDYSLITLTDPKLSLFSLNSIGDYYGCAVNFLGTIGIYTKNLLLFLEIIFSIFGYSLLVYRFRKESGKKKQFLGLAILYCSVSFLVIMPVIGDSPLRYFLLSFFAPYIFLGLLGEYAIKRFRFGLFLVALVFLFLTASNYFSLKSVAGDLAAEKRSGSLVCGPDTIVLGEIEPMAGFITQESHRQGAAYLLHTSRYTFFNPIKYLSQKDGMTLSLITGKELPNIPPGAPLFYFSENLFIDPSFLIYGRKIENYRNFSRVTIYELQN
ncbi:MAG: glycosyltransferase family 39 protein [Candidatus Moranbacteria bacterium]|nr:glycosyltransferase family 39 protein [Candidatus Moranbacteria bacterium]